MGKGVEGIIPAMVTPFNDRDRIEKMDIPGYDGVSMTGNVR